MDRGVDQWSTAGTLSVGDRTLKKAKLSVEELGVLNSTEPRLRVGMSAIQKYSQLNTCTLGIKGTYYIVLAQSQYSLQADVGASSSGL